MTDFLKNPIFTDEAAAREWLEARVWPHGPVCPHCGNADQAQNPRPTGQSPPSGRVSVRRVPRAVHRDREDGFRAVPYQAEQVAGWASSLMASSKKGVSAHQLHRSLGVDYKSAWFMCHRIPRGDGRRGVYRRLRAGPLGGKGKVVEADESDSTAKPKPISRAKSIAGGGGLMPRRGKFKK